MKKCILISLCLMLSKQVKMYNVIMHPNLFFFLLYVAVHRPFNNLHKMFQVVSLYGIGLDTRGPSRFYLKDPIFVNFTYNFVKKKFLWKSFFVCVCVCVCVIKCNLMKFFYHFLINSLRQNEYEYITDHFKLCIFQV